MRLTEKVIEGLVTAEGQRDRMVFDDDQRGLAVRITRTGSKTYLAQYTFDGRKYRLPLGAVSAVSLKAARDAAAVVMGRVAAGENPALDRRERIKREQASRDRDLWTMRKLVDSWEAALAAGGRKAKYAAEATRALRFGFQRHLNRPAEALTRAVVVQTLDQMPPAMHARTAAYGRACYAWAVKRGTMASNPFLNLPTPSIVARDRVLSDDELVAIWKASEADTSRFGPLVRLLLLTGQRREEVGAMAWVELSDDGATWTLPASRAKNTTVHIVPLSEPVRAILAAIPRISPLVFGSEGGKPFNAWSKAKAALDKASGVADWRLHDLRRTFATGCQRLGVRLEVTEALLNHVSGTRAGIAGVYQRHHWREEKRAAMAAWGVHVIALVTGTAVKPNVLPMKRGRKG